MYFPVVFQMLAWGVRAMLVAAITAMPAIAAPPTLDTSLSLPAGSRWIPIALGTNGWAEVEIQASASDRRAEPVVPTAVWETPGAEIRPKPYAASGYTQYQLYPRDASSGLEVVYGVNGDFDGSVWEETFELTTYIEFESGEAFSLTLDRHPRSVGLYLHRWRENSGERSHLLTVGQEPRRLRMVYDPGQRAIGFWVDNTYLGAFRMSSLSTAAVRKITHSFSLQNYRGNKDFGAWPVLTEFSYLKSGDVDVQPKLGHYPLRASGTDISGHGNHGVVQGAPAFGEIAGRKGIHFTGDYRQYLRIPHRRELNFASSFSLAAWIYSEQSAGSLLSKGRDVEGGWRLTGGGKAFGLNSRAISDGVWIEVADSEFLPNRWNHVAIVADTVSGTLHYFLNGTRARTTRLPATFGVSTSHDLVIGRHDALNDGRNYYPYPFTGWLADVRLYDRALSAEEVRTLGATQEDCVFDWAESSFSAFLAPAGGRSLTTGDYYYRHYPGTGAYLGSHRGDGHLYYRGPVSNESMMDLGRLSEWSAQAGCTQ